MKAPSGIRIGTLCLTSLTGILDGTLKLFNRAVPVPDEVDERRNCHLSENLITLIQTIPYTTSGTITSHAISLLLHSDHGESDLTGVEATETAECVQ